MGRLVLLNGVPGAGKSTLARRYAEDHPLTLVLEIDTVRAMLGGWLDRPTEAGLVARAVAIEMARVHLRTGREVIVPQYLGRVEFVRDLEQLCAEVGVAFVEIALQVDPEGVRTRFARRSASPETAEHRDAAMLQDRSGGIAALEHTVRRLSGVIATRPGTRIVSSVDGRIDETYQALLIALG